MADRDTAVARKYHDQTKHTSWRVRTSQHTLDWANKPAPFKVYHDLPRVQLPADLPDTDIPVVEALAARQRDAQETVTPTLRELAHILYYAAGVTKRLRHSNGEFYFRAAACAGALYPIELYVVCGDLPDLNAGVYHFNPGDYALRQLRTGDYRPVLRRASGNHSHVRAAPVTLIATAITWRSAWKYQARSYRYHFWDAGTILSNALAASAANRLPASLVAGYVDHDVNRLLGIDGEWEKSLCLMPVGRVAAGDVPDSVLDVAAIDPAVEPLSQRHKSYPLIDEMHAASSLDTSDEVAIWHDAAPARSRPLGGGELYHLGPLDRAGLPDATIETVVPRRGSARRFRRESISFGELSTLLRRATVSLLADWAPDGPLLNDLYLNVHAVDGLPAGAYVYRPHDQSLEQLKTGDFRDRSAGLCLWQDLGGDASATVFYLADLDPILHAYGNRGYRVAQLEAGIIGGKLYLGAYALGRGATGLTFFDDEVVDFFSPHAAGKTPIFVTALGVPAPPADRSGQMVRVRPGESVMEGG